MQIHLGRTGRAHPTARTVQTLAGLLLLLRAAAAPPDAGPWVVDADLVDRLAAEMRTNHPALRALDARADAAVYQAEGVRTWADPRMQVGGEVTREGQTMARGRGDLIYGLQQNLPVLGKEQAGRRVAEAMADTAATRAESRFQELRRDLADTLLETAFAEEVVRLDGEDLDWLDRMIPVLAARVSAGTTPSPALVRIQNERSRRATDLSNHVAVLAARRASVNRLLGRQEDDGFHAVVLPPPTPAIPPDPAVFTLALNAEPRLQIARRQVTEAGRVVEHTRRTRRPDLAIGVQGRQYSGDAGFREGMFLLSFNLPWLNRSAYRSDLLRDEARLEAAGLDQADLELAVREEVQHLLVRIANAERDARLHQDDLLPRTATLAADLEALWTSGRADAAEVLSARRELVAVRLRIARSIADEWIALSDLLICCGLTDLETLRIAGGTMALSGNPNPASR